MVPSPSCVRSRRAGSDPTVLGGEHARSGYRGDKPWGYKTVNHGLDGHPLGDRDGEQLANLRRQRIGYLPQEPAPIGFLSAEENTVLVLRIRGWSADTAAERAVDVLTRAGLTDRAHQRACRLSAGEAQRLALVRALASARGLLIVDEATSRQDGNNARAVAALLAAAAHEEGQTVICATHDPAVIRQADKIVAPDG